MAGNANDHITLGKGPFSRKGRWPVDILKEVREKGKRACTLATARLKGRKSTSYLAEKNTIKAILLPHSPLYLWGEGCSAHPFINEPGLSLKAEVMLPGTSEQPHYHEHARQYFHIQQGTAHFLLPEGLVKVLPGETLLIPAGLPHCISNQKTATLEFLVLSLPSTANDRVVVPEIPTQL